MIQSVAQVRQFRASCASPNRCVRSWVARAAVGLAVLTSCAIVAPSLALAAPTAADKETARTLVKSGRKKRKDGNLQGARKDFEAAHAIMQVPVTGYELGRAQAELGLLVEARDTLLEAGRYKLKRGDSYQIAQARADAKKLSKKVADRIPSVKITITGSAADGATVELDGNELLGETLGSPIKLNPGEHEVVARNGEAEETARFGVSESEQKDVELTLDAPPPEPDVPVAAPPVRTEPEQTTNPMVYVGFGVFGAGAIVGSITGIMALSKFGDVAPQCPNNRCPPETHDDIDSGETLGTISTISFVVAGIGAAGGVMGLFMPIEVEASAEGDSSAGLRIGPTHLSIEGRF